MGLVLTMSLKIGPSYLVSHSAGATYAILLSNDCGSFIVASINLEPAPQPFRSYGAGLNETYAGRPWGITSTHVTYAPAVADPASELTIVEVGTDTLETRSCFLQAEPARQLPAISAVKFLQITSEASVHATYDHCMMRFLEQAGGTPEWLKLADVEIHGNGHFMHMELNNMEIAQLVDGWIQANN